jgi:hypothetical protein
MAPEQAAGATLEPLDGSFGDRPRVPEQGIAAATAVSIASAAVFDWPADPAPSDGPGPRGVARTSGPAWGAPTAPPERDDLGGGRSSAEPPVQPVGAGRPNRSAPTNGATGWEALDASEEQRDRRRWLLLAPLVLLLGWLLWQWLQPTPILSLAITSDGMLAPPANQVVSGQALGPEQLTIANDGTASACWWISATSDNPALAALVTLHVRDAAGHTLYTGPVPGAAPAIVAGSACAHPPIGVPSGTEATLALGASATLTVTGSVGDLPAALNGALLTITWTSIGAPADR